MIELQKGVSNTVKIKVTDKDTKSPVNLAGKSAVWRLVSNIDVMGDSVIIMQGTGVVSSSIVTMYIDVLPNIDYGIYTLEILFPLRDDFLYDPMRITVKILDEIPQVFNPLPILVDFEVLDSKEIISTVVAELDKEQFFLPTVLGGHVTDYNDCFATFTIFVDENDDTENWDITQIRGDGLTISELENSRTATVIGLTDDVNQSSIKFIGSKDGYSDVMKEFFITKLINNSLTVIVESTNGDSFKITSNKSTRLKARVYEGATEITEDINPLRLQWRRVSYYDNPIGDEIWNQQHSSGFKEIDIVVSSKEVIGTYFCDII